MSTNEKASDYDWLRGICERIHCENLYGKLKEIATCCVVVSGKVSGWKGNSWSVQITLSDVIFDVREENAERKAILTEFMNQWIASENTETEKPGSQGDVSHGGRRFSLHEELPYKSEQIPGCEGKRRFFPIIDVKNKRTFESHLYLEEMPRGVEAELDLKIWFRDKIAEDVERRFEISEVRVKLKEGQLVGISDYKDKVRENSREISRLLQENVELFFKREFSYHENKNFYVDSDYKIKVPNEYIEDWTFDKSVEAIIYGTGEEWNCSNQAKNLYENIAYAMSMMSYYEFINGFFDVPDNIKVGVRKAYLINVVQIMDALVDRTVKRIQERCNTIEDGKSCKCKECSEDNPFKCEECKTGVSKKCDYYFATKKEGKNGKVNTKFTDHIEKMKELDMFNWDYWDDITTNYDNLIEVYKARNRIHLSEKKIDEKLSNSELEDISTMLWDLINGLAVFVKPGANKCLRELVESEKRATLEAW